MKEKKKTETSTPEVKAAPPPPPPPPPAKVAAAPPPAPVREAPTPRIVNGKPAIFRKCRRCPDGNEAEELSRPGSHLKSFRCLTCNGTDSLPTGGEFPF